MIEQVKPSTEKLRMIRNEMEANIATKHKSKRYLAAVLAAIALTAFSVTAFAYGNEIIGVIKQFMMGNSNIEQVENIPHDGDGTVIVLFEIANRSVTIDEHGEYKEFSTTYEANQVAPFVIKEPKYLPESVRFEAVGLRYLTNGSYGYEADISYTATKENDISTLGLTQYYVGDDAYINLKTVSSIEKIDVGNIEATFVQSDNPNSPFGERLDIFWIEDGVVYWIYCTGIDKGTLLEIAKSLEP